jgi:cytochrome c oxidase subunit III
MSATLLPPTVTPAPEEAVRPSDNGGNGGGGGNFEERHYGPNENPESDPERWKTPLSAYRTAALFAVFSITSVFATLTHILASRWVHSKDWVPIGLPHILYLNTAVLLASSFTFEFARSSLAREALQGCVRWLSTTLILGVAFVAGQIVAWRQFIGRGLHLGSNLGSFFFYCFTAAHAIHLLGGVIALFYVILFANRLSQRGRQKTAVSAVAFYWHFMDGLWLYLLALLFMTIQH